MNVETKLCLVFLTLLLAGFVAVAFSVGAKLAALFCGALAIWSATHLLAAIFRGPGR